MKMNIVGNLGTHGGGEQSLIDIYKLMVRRGHDVTLIPWDKVHDDYKEHVTVDFSMMAGLERMVPGHPTFFYGNDSIYKFCEGIPEAQLLVDRSSALVIGVNFTLASLRECEWLAKTNKLNLVTFLSSDKMLFWWERGVINNLFPNTQVLQVPNIIDNAKFLAAPVRRRGDDPLIVCRTSRGDTRKFVTRDEKVKLGTNYFWQQNLTKMPDIDMYLQLLESMPNLEFRFMLGSAELKKEFAKHPAFKFYDWNQIPVKDFLAQAHVFMYRCSDHCDEQGPRTIHEALLAGLPCITEPRNGTLDRVVHGLNGYLCTDADSYEAALQKLYHNEDHRYVMAKLCRNEALTRFHEDKWYDPVFAAMNGDQYVPDKYTPTFTTSSPTPMEYEALKVFIKRHNIKKVLEFGPGTSTYAFIDAGCEVTTCEFSDKWYKYAELNLKNVPNVELRKFNSDKEVTIDGLSVKPGDYDLCFVDSPPGTRGLSRINTCVFALSRGLPVILHDTRRPGEQQTIKHLKASMGLYVEEILSYRGLTYMRLGV